MTGEQQMKPFDIVNRYGLILGYGLSGLTAIILPLLLWSFPSRFISNTYGKQQELFELFSLVMVVFLAGWAMWQIRRRPPASTWLPLGLMVLVGGQYLLLLNEYSHKSWDYLCYENAAQAILENQNPYTDTPERCYLYPPLLAQTLAVAWQGVQPFSFPAPHWHVVFYLYQCGQFFLILAAFWLCYRLALKIGFWPVPAALLITALFVLNNPLVRTLRHNQLNLWMLGLILAGMLWLPRRPLWAGLAVALAIHLKLFAVVLLPIWLLKKQWRGLVAAGGGLLLLLLVQTGWGRYWIVWEQFITYYNAQPLNRFIRFRNNSLRSVVFNTLRTMQLGLDRELTQTIGTVVVFILTLLVALWLLYRFWQREQGSLTREMQMIGHSLDGLAFVLIAAPITWEHHYVLALPLLVWGFAQRGREAFWWMVAAAFLMVGIPTFDVFPLSFHQLAGLLLWLYLTSPHHTLRPVNQFPL